MRHPRLAAGAFAAGSLLAACDAPHSLQLAPEAAPAAAPALSSGSTSDSAALAAAGITWKVVTIVPPEEPTVAVGQQLQLESVVEFDSSTFRNASAVEWTSSDPSVVPNPVKGLVIGRRSGTALITATLGWHGFVHSDTLRVTVTSGAVPNPALAAPTAPQAADVGAELPRATVDTRMPAQTGRTISVRADDDLQDALDAARPGDVVLLQNGATFRGSFMLRPKTGAGWIVVRPASLAGIPQAGTRVTPENAAAMPKIVMPGGNDGAIRTMGNAGYYRFVGVEITAAPTLHDFNALVRLNYQGARSAEQFPHHIVFDRTYIHAQPEQGVTRCVMMNSASTAIIDSYLANCHAKGRDAQAIASWNAPGPFKIVNNYLEGSGENVMFGGAPAAAPDFIPADITIQRNHFFKPLDWKGRWTIKNLFELKGARRVLAEGNVFENNWAAAQTGFAINIKSSAGRNTPWLVTEDVTFRYNVVRNSTAGLTIADAPDGPAQPARRLRIEQNLFAGLQGRMFQLIGALSDVTLAHNTAVMTGSGGTAVSFDHGKGRGLNLRVVDNVLTKGSYGVKGSGAGTGTASLNAYWNTYTFSGNVLVGSSGDRRSYPANNTFVESLAQIGLTALGTSAGDVEVSAARTIGAYSAAGVDATELARMTRGVDGN